ncbi:MAG TPA: arginase family protein, partial [Micavibrio sp.]
MNPISLIPYVCGAGASLLGSEQGPLYCREHGLTEKLAEKGVTAGWAVDPEIHWSGPYGKAAHEALKPLGAPERYETVSWHCQTLARNVAAELARGNQVITIGGDHSMGAGSISGMREAFGPDAEIGVIWVDAHPDLNTLKTSPSNALHGMPVAVMLGLEKSLPGMGGAALKPENLLYAGLRSIDEGEYANAAQLGINLLTMDELRRQGIAKTLRNAVAGMAARCDHLILSIDLDAFSTDVAPAVGSPVPGGFMPD